MSKEQNTAKPESPRTRRASVLIGSAAHAEMQLVSEAFDLPFRVVRQAAGELASEAILATLRQRLGADRLKGREGRAGEARAGDGRERCSVGAGDRVATMNRCRTFDPYLTDLHTLERLADPEPPSGGRAVVWVLALALVLTLAAGATWATRAGGPFTRGGAVPMQLSGEGGTAASLARGVSSPVAESAETARATGEESGLGSPGVGAR